ncbi:J domain-containing protein [Parathermosynechococcus lividus]
MGHLGQSHYEVLDVPPSASLADIRRAYREKSKLYHPDTTTLPAAIAREEFHRLNEAYAVLTNAEQRQWYDLQLQLRSSRSGGVSSPPSQPSPQFYRAVRSQGDRPLSAGELFALFILGVTFVGCLLLAVIVGFSQQGQEWILQIVQIVNNVAA